MPWLPFAIYLLIGPLPWLALLVIGHFAGARMSRFQEVGDVSLPTPAPTLTVLVPAKDEAVGIGACIGAIAKLDYPQFDVVAIDDRSTDGTGDVLERIAAQPASPGFGLCVHRIRELPPGWLGKCHALHVGTCNVSSDWLLFVDSDVTITADSARRAIAICEERGWDALSLLPTLDARSFWERLLLPLLAVSWAAAFRVSQTNDDSRPDRAFASGGFFLIRRSWYDRVGGHAAVRDQIVEDIMLMRTLKRAGAKVRLQFGQHLVSARMHATLPEMYAGWSRILAGTTSRRVRPLLGVVAWIVLCCASIVPAVVCGALVGPGERTPWLLGAGMHAILLVAFAARVYRASRQPLWLALLLPLAVPMVVSVYVRAIRTSRVGRIVWRATAVELAKGPTR
jgi:chlorobactene glucosyltransferase